MPNGDPKTFPRASKDHRKLVFVISTIGGGGAERVAALLMNEWARRGDKVLLVTLDEGKDAAYELDPRIRRIGLDVMSPAMSRVGAILANCKRISKLRGTFKAESPDLVLSFMDRTNVLTLISTIGFQIPTIVSERVSPLGAPLSASWALLRRVVYTLADGLVVQTEDVRQWARDQFSKVEVTVIPNPLREPHLPPTGEHEERKHWLMGMGRLCEQKGFDLLIKAFARGAAKFPDWNLVILGEGEERRTLEAQVRSLGLADRVTLPGWMPNIDEILSRADVFVLPSRFEGFPNALLEAMAVGLPVVAFDCPSGPADILRNGLDGLLVPPGDWEALATHLEALMASPIRRKELSEKARDAVRRYKLGPILEAWDAVFLAATSQRQRHKPVLT